MLVRPGLSGTPLNFQTSPNSIFLRPTAGLTFDKKKKRELNKENQKLTVKYGDGKVIVWTCMSTGGVRKSEFTEGTQGKNSISEKVIYCIVRRILEKEQKFAFTKITTQTWLTWNGAHSKSPPAQSPDKNVFKNLWALLDKIIGKKLPQKPHNRCSNQYQPKSMLLLRQKAFHTRYQNLRLRVICFTLFKNELKFIKSVVWRSLAVNVTAEAISGHAPPPICGFPF